MKMKKSLRRAEKYLRRHKKEILNDIAEFLSLGSFVSLVLTLEHGLEAYKAQNSS